MGFRTWQLSNKCVLGSKRKLNHTIKGSGDNTLYIHIYVYMLYVYVYMLYVYMLYVYMYIDIDKYLKNGRKTWSYF